MICKKCGKNIDDNSKFCAYCGETVEEKTAMMPDSGAGQNPKGNYERPGISSNEMNLHTNQGGFSDRNPKERPKKKFNLLVVIIPIVAVLAIGLGAFFFLNNPSRKMNEAIKSADIDNMEKYYSKLSDKQQEETDEKIDAMAQEVYDSYNNGDIEYKEASEKLNAWKKLTKTETTSALVTDISKLRSSKLSFAEAEKYNKEGDTYSLQKALEAYSAVIDDDKNKSTAKERITELKTNYKTAILEEAADYADGGDYDIAISELEQSEDIIGSDSEIKEAVKKYQQEKIDARINDTIKTAQNYYDSDDIENAIAELGNISSSEATDESKSLLKQYKDEYKKQILEDAQKAADSQDYSQAITVLNGSADILGSDSDIQTKIDEYKEFMPVLLGNLKPISGSEVGLEGDYSAIYDTLGNRRENVMPIGNIDKTYKIDGKYKSLTFTAFTDEEYASDLDVSHYQIYTDGNLVYEYKGTGLASTAPFDVSVDLTGVTEMHIVCEFDNTLAAESGKSYMLDWSDARLNK